MEELIAFGTRDYGLYWGMLVVARSMDFLSTWVATPHLVLEANPLARKLGWRWGAVVNVIMCTIFAMWPLPAVVIATTSVLVAARNFQSAWLMRTLGEDDYRNWVIQQIGRTPFGLYLFCLIAQSLLYAAVGSGLILWSQEQLAPFGVGMGLITYAIAVLFYSLLSVYRIRRSNSTIRREVLEDL
jgi:hypothetical protein